MHAPAEDQDAAYELAVRSAWHDPRFAEVVERSFLDEDPMAALERFRGSEDLSRVLRLLKREGVTPPARVLDLGGGRGLLSAALAERGYDVVLSEPNPSAVCGASAAEELRARAGGRYAITRDLVQDLEPASFDAVVCRAVLHHLEPLVDVLRATCRVLRPGGVLIAADEPTVERPELLDAARARHPFVGFGVDEQAYPPATYREALREAGFATARTEFPVAFDDYRHHVRQGPLPLVAALYARYRLRARVRPTPGQVVTVTGVAPAA